MNPFSVQYLVCFSWLLGAFSVSADEFEVSAEDDSDLVFTVMAFGDRMFDGIHYENANDEVEELEFNPYGRSQAYRSSKDDQILEFFSERKNARGAVVRTPMARFDCSKISERGLLVFFPNYRNNSGLPYHVIGVDESDSLFGEGDFRFLNITGTELLARIGEEESILKSGFSEVFSFDVENRKPIDFQFAAKFKDEWKLVYATKRQSDRNRGTLFILKPPATLDSLRIGVQALVEKLP